MKIEFDNALNEAGWELVSELRKFGDVNGHMFNNIKQCLKSAIEVYLSESEKVKPIPQTKEVEWVNGDIAIYEGKEALVIAYHPHHPSVVIELPCNEYLNVLSSELSKPETQEDREKRERDEKKAIDVNAMCLSVVSLKLSQAVALYDAGYRKGGG